MNESVLLFGSVLAGSVLGTIFFGGLWWTVQKGTTSSRPARLFMISLLVRMSLLLTGFYLVGHGNAGRLVACVFGVLLARFAVMQITKGSTAHRKELRHAPES